VAVVFTTLELAVTSPVAAQRTFVVEQAGKSVAVEHFEQVADTVNAELDIESRQTVERARLVTHLDRPGVFDLEADVPSGKQFLHLEVDSALARLKIIIGDKHLDTTVALSPDTLVLVYENLMFSLLQPVLGSINLSPGSSQPISVLIPARATKEIWHVERDSTGTLLLRTAAQLGIELKFEGCRLVQIEVPSQHVVIKERGRAAEDPASKSITRASSPGSTPHDQTKCLPR
jgi:hypothetical protein